MIQKFKKKPVVIEAVKFTRDNWEEIMEFTNHSAHSFRTGRNEIDYCIIPTLEGQHEATEGDYIIKGIAGEFYPCKPDIFEKTYELHNQLKQITMKDIQYLVKQWAQDRGLLKNENSIKQALKLSEEVGELASAILKSKYEEQVDAIGDIQVVLIILSEQLGINYDKALESAYRVIENRKGKTENGIFIKNE